MYKYPDSWNLTKVFSADMYRIVLLAVCFQISFASLPLGWKSCKMSSRDYDKCLRQQVLYAISTLKNGDKRLGVSSIDPLIFDTLIIDQSNGPVSIMLDFKNFTFTGLSKCKIVHLQNDWKELRTTLMFDKIVTKGSYKISGKMLFLPIQGEGPSTLEWLNMSVIANFTFKEVDRKGKKYFQVPEFFLDINPKKMVINFENLFNGNKALGDYMNTFMNENWEDIIKELKPSIERALARGFKQVTNQVLSKIPKNEIEIK